MSRTERLLDLLQALRRRTRAVSARTLAQEFGVTIRTIYRDLGTLQAQGAPIEGEAGVGYLLRPGYTLPPLMFTSEELEALVLGARWVISRGDPTLGKAARNSLAKINAVLTPGLRDELDATTLIVAPSGQAKVDGVKTAMVRASIRGDEKLLLDYEDQGGGRSARTVWPFALGYFDHAQIVMAWCELRRDFRSFRMDRILKCSRTGEKYPERHQSLHVRWQEEKGIPASVFGTPTES